MTPYQIDTLRKDIRVALDENKVSTALLNLNDIDTLSLNELIDSNIEAAARVIERSAPVEMLGTGKDITGDITWSTELTGAGSIELDEDFLRLVSFRMSDWKRAVSTAITDTSLLYQQMQSKYGGIRGNTESPIVAIFNNGENMVLEFYSSATNTATIAHGTYISIPTIHTATSEETTSASVTGKVITISHLLYHAVKYYAAYLVALSLKDADLATAMLSISKELINQE